MCVCVCVCVCEGLRECLCVFLRARACVRGFAPAPGPVSEELREGLATRKSSLKFHTRVLSGRRPVMNELREGEHTCCCTKARVKVSAVWVKESMFGVFMNVWP